MAVTFKFNAVYKSVSNNLFYIQDGKKMIPEKDLFTVIEYVDGEHAALLYGKAHGTSVNPKLAAEEFMDDRNKYFEFHKMWEGAKLCGQGKNSKGETKQEILAHHIYLSAAESDGDKVTPEILNEIMDRFLKAMKWDNHRSVQAPHLNTRHKHIHASVCAYDMEGKTKLHMKNATVYRAKIELNYICADYGLSIIDDTKVYAWAGKNMPEYCEWLDAMKRNKTVEIYKNIPLEMKKQKAEERKAKRAAKAEPPKDIGEEIESVIAYNKGRRKGYATDYYAAGRFINPHRQRPYRMNLYDHSGRRRSTIELVLLLVAAILVDTNRYAVENQYPPFRKHDRELQKMIDGIATARAYGVASSADIQEKIAECGKWIGSCKKAIVRLEKELEKGADERLEKELEKYQKNLLRYKKDYGNLIRLREPIKEIARGKYDYRTALFEYVNNQEKAKELQDGKAETGRKLSISEQILYAEKQKRECIQRLDDEKLFSQR